MLRLLKLTNINKKYGKKTIFKNVNLHLNRGEKISILGSSGIGKSSLLKIIDEADKEYSGKMINDFKKTIYLEQKPVFLPWLNTYEQIRLVDSEESNIIKSINRFNLNEYLYLYPSEYSGGIAQRVALSQYSSLSSDLFLLDEPFSALDKETKFKTIEAFKDLIDKNNVSIILVTHDLKEAKYLTDKVYLLTKEGFTNYD